MNSEEAPYGPWGGLGIMALWVARRARGGYTCCSRERDA